jgi:hypothetical protein
VFLSSNLLEGRVYYTNGFFFTTKKVSQRKEGGRKRGERIERRETGQRRGRPAGRLVAPTRGEKGERGERRKEKGMRSGGG